MGRVIKKGAVLQKVNTMNAELNNLQGTIEETYQNLKQISEKEAELSGIAWSKFQTYLRDVQLPILITFRFYTELMIEANNQYAQAASGLSESVLEEDLIKDTIRHMERERENVIHRMNSYTGVHSLAGNHRPMLDF